MPFGEEIASSETNRKAALGYNYANTTRQHFTGYEKDSESGLEFAQNRYYSSKFGRFTTVDPMMASGDVRDAQSWNRYAYVRNNPLNLTDPLGLLFGVKPGENFVTYFKDLDALKAAGATEVSSYFYQVGSTIYVLHPTRNMTAFAQTFEEAARLFTNDWRGSQALGKAAWAAAGLAAAAFATAVAGGAYAAAGLYSISNHETMPMACSPRFAMCTGNNIASQQVGSQAMASEAKQNAELEKMVPPVVSDTAAPNPQDPDEKPPQDPNKPKKTWHEVKKVVQETIRDTIAQAKKDNGGFESGRHGNWATTAAERLRKIAEGYRERGDLPELWKPLLKKSEELLKQKINHKGGGTRH